MSEDFSREILKVAVAYICSTFGFQSAEQAPLETLVDILQLCKNYCSEFFT
jgi:hypothetical protein